MQAAANWFVDKGYKLKQNNQVEVSFRPFFILTNSPDDFLIKTRFTRLTSKRNGIDIISRQVKKKIDFNDKQ